ncbi:MAG: glycosyltransferase family 4 protein [Steroidobacteraceae bacterium]
MSATLFFDPSCQKPYCRRTLDAAALGGTEASVVRIAEALDARVMQHNRLSSAGRYLPAGPASGVEHLIVLRDPRAFAAIGKRFPGARHYLWIHDLMRPGSKRGRRLAAAAPVLAQLGVTLVCVSDFQRRQAEAVLAGAGVGTRVRAVTIYNPIDDGLVPDGSPVDPSKLVFFSSPNKGLALTLDAFRALRRELPDLRLCIGSPGYKSLRRAGMQGVDGKIDGVEWLGPLPQLRMLAEVRTALCGFYLNLRLPETFGLVLAEAHSVGTPVLTHDFGAAAEVVADPRQVLPITAGIRLYERAAHVLPNRARPLIAPWAARLGLFRPYLEHLQRWRAGGRPSTGPDPRFRLSTVAQRWRALLDGAV